MSKYLGNNIRSLRLAYGETQEQLGVAIHVEKNTVSYYETGQRVPNNETLDAIAKHFMISVWELQHCDFSGIGKFNYDKEFFWRNIRYYLPIVSSEKAIKNPAFKRTFEVQQKAYQQLHEGNMDGMDGYDVLMDCLFQYLEIADEDNVEASANLLGLWYLLMMITKTTPGFLENQPAILQQATKHDKELQRIIEEEGPTFISDTNDLLEDLDSKEAKEMISEILTVIKRSKEWSDLADYYLALQYICNLVDNDLDWGFNQRIGIEMINTFASVKNPYAAMFKKISKISAKSMRSGIK